MAVTQTKSQFPVLATHNTSKFRSGSVASMSSSLPSLRKSSSTMATSISPLYGVYPAFLPPASEVSSRINPLHPEASRRKVGLQTVDPHWHNEQRSLRMKQREHFRYHNAWSKYYYGSLADQEAHGAEIRAVLKQQMDDKQRSERFTMKEKVRESEAAVERDMQDRLKDSMDYQRRSEYLKTFTKDNKRLMEFGWDLKKHTKEMEDRYDREQLQFNPINWSGTLK